MSNFMQSVKPKWESFKESMYLLFKNPLSAAALIVLAILVLSAIFAPFIIPYPQDIADEARITEKLQPPSAEHWFGTDELGRDVFSRVVYGGRISLTAAFLAVGLALVIGVPLGAIAGAYGGKIDNLIMRITDVFLSFPPLLLAIALVAIMGKGLVNACLATVIAWWPWYTRLVRGQAISIKERVFIQAAETIGTPTWKIILKHILPNCLSPVIVQASMDIGGIILTVAGLSFLGLGASAPQPEWGLMISTGRTYFPDMWWYCIFPGIAIFITVLCFNILGDALREIMDPKTRKR